MAVFAATLAGASALAAPSSGSLRSDGCAAARVAYSGPDGAIWVAAADHGAAHRVSTISGLSPTWSPDGNQIAFRHIDGQGSAIFVVNVDGTHEHPLTSGTSDWSPAWSPDGSRIAFSTYSDGAQRIATVKPDGRNEVLLTPDQEGEYPAWSPDSSQLAFASAANGQYDIWIMNADGSQRHNLTHNPAYDMYPAWSPDGRKIAFGSDRTKPDVADFVEQDVFVMEANGSDIRNVTRTQTIAEGFPAWRPDGSLSYVRGNDQAHPPTLWRSDANGHEARSDGFGGQFPAWEPGGATGCWPPHLVPRLAFVRTDASGSFDLYTAAVDGSGAIDITNSPATESFPAWSPDGSRLLFVRGNRVGHGHLEIANGGGPTPYEPYPSIADVRSAAWAPDGQRIAFSLFGSGLLYLGASDGSAAHALKGPHLTDSPAWSPNGRFLAYRQEFPGNDELMRIDLVSSRVLRLTRRPASNEFTPIWSPDNREIAYSSDTGRGSSIWIMNADGGGAHRLTTDGDGVGFPAWTSDGANVVYERHGALWITRADGVGDHLLVHDADFPAISRTSSGSEHSAITIQIRRSRRREFILVTGSLTSGPQRIGNARVELRCSWRRQTNHKRTSGTGTFRFVVPFNRRNRAGTITAFFAGDSSTLASLAFRRSRLSSRPK